MSRCPGVHKSTIIAPVGDVERREAGKKHEIDKDSYLLRPSTIQALWNKKCLYNIYSKFRRAFRNSWQQVKREKGSQKLESSIEDLSSESLRPASLLQHTH
jgi:hypothetical protein